jgi:hypothetical protein
VNPSKGGLVEEKLMYNSKQTVKFVFILQVGVAAECVVEGVAETEVGSQPA